MEGLIEIENPNRVAQKSKKVTQIELDEPKQLSRRERFVISGSFPVIKKDFYITSTMAYFQSWTW